MIKSAVGVTMLGSDGLSEIRQRSDLGITLAGIDYARCWVGIGSGLAGWELILLRPSIIWLRNGYLEFLRWILVGH